MDVYKIVDEPEPGVLSSITVNPIWPLFGYMFGGSFFSWAWYGANSYAIGSPTKKKKLLGIITGIFLVLVYFFILVMLNALGIIPDGLNKYLRLVVVVIHLTTFYTLYYLQSQPFEIYQYFGGKVNPGFFGVVVSFVIGPKLDMIILKTYVEFLTNVI